ncbi:SprT family zinc-dependent metalloprotease [Arthrobacter sp. H5]|uniref:M48 family metallopeptidase n=1 Tax=Arthrobacter sp. H5 TaxID=1267973 RepID=UPI00047FEE4D|nr:SprT family zinc-dependent metalloprotease [Arthrobacter sp. H5]
MMPETRQVHYGEQIIEYRLERRERSTLEITVEPDGLVRVAAPIEAAVEDIATRVRRRARWILAQQRTFARFHPRTPPRRYVPGETHLYLGRQYRIQVSPNEAVDGPDAPRVRMVRGFLEVTGVAFRDTAAIERHITLWFRQRARLHLPRRVELNRQRFPDPTAVEPAGLRLLRMPTRWGSMSPAGRLLLNPDLIRAPMDSIDYVITHELCHLLIPSHSRNFYELQETVMPDWQRRKERLERIMA